MRHLERMTDADHVGGWSQGENEIVSLRQKESEIIELIGCV